MSDSRSSPEPEEEDENEISVSRPSFSFAKLLFLNLFTIIAVVVHRPHKAGELLAPVVVTVSDLKDNALESATNYIENFDCEEFIA